MNDQVRDSQRLTGVRSETFEPSDLFHHSSFIIHHSLSLALLLAVLLPTARAQPTGAPPHDPLMSLMLSQPRLTSQFR